MRNNQKKQAEDYIVQLRQAHERIGQCIAKGEALVAMELLEQCQTGAIRLGDLIEQEEGTDCRTISYIEDYCEVIYQIYEAINADSNETTGFNETVEGAETRLNKSLHCMEDSIQRDIKVQYEVVFFPYKAQMWDSLESVWMAADADPDCDAYVIPIPYYTRNAEGRLEEYHYEGEEMPENVPVTHYEDYDIAERRPDVIYIHNPYDQANHVISIDPRYYAKELKKYTDMLVYIPYYVTSGVTGPGQWLCQVYLDADYIVMQSEISRPYFHKAIPQKKLLPLGSPKVDRVVRMSKNPSEPPEGWKERMEGKKVYFYNTSVGGMLADTEHYLQKMLYVFQSFQGREDTCLIWRPHPLLEATIASMRNEFLTIYENIKDFFLQQNLGIYDGTPDIDKTIAFCDAYIGDDNSSVTALFGVLGKPLFLLNNSIHTLPQEGDWRGDVLCSFDFLGNNDWQVMQGNKLYYAPGHDHHYEYYCSLSEYMRGDYYYRAFEINGMVYVCPFNAQDILVIGQHKVLRKIALERCVERWGAFAYAWNIGKYIFLIPYQYPAIVRYDTEADHVDYLTGGEEILAGNPMEDGRPAASCVWNDYLIIAEAQGHRALAIESSTMEVQAVTVQEENSCGRSLIAPVGDEIWLLPYEGRTVTRWNPQTGETKEYSDFPAGFFCMDKSTNQLCDMEPFAWATAYQNNVILSPNHANMFVLLHPDTGETEEWIPPVPIEMEQKNGYFNVGPQNATLFRLDGASEESYRLFDGLTRTMYDMNLESGEYQEVIIEVNTEDLRKNECGFCEESEWHPYVVCKENAFNSLEDFLNHTITGAAFEKEKQLLACQKIVENMDGTCGQVIHDYIRGQI